MRKVGTDIQMRCRFVCSKWKQKKKLVLYQFAKFPIGKVSFMNGIHFNYSKRKRKKISKILIFSWNEWVFFTQFFIQKWNQMFYFCFWSHFYFSIQFHLTCSRCRLAAICSHYLNSMPKNGAIFSCRRIVHIRFLTSFLFMQNKQAHHGMAATDNYNNISCIKRIFFPGLHSFSNSKARKPTTHLFLLWVIFVYCHSHNVRHSLTKYVSGGNIDKLFVIPFTSDGIHSKFKLKFEWIYLNANSKKTVWSDCMWMRITNRLTSLYTDSI